VDWLRKQPSLVRLMAWWGLIEEVDDEE